MQFLQQVVAGLSNSVIIADESGEIVYASELPPALNDVAPENFIDSSVDSVLRDRDGGMSITEIRERTNESEQKATTVVEHSDHRFLLYLSETAYKTDHYYVIEIRELHQGDVRDGTYFKKLFEAVNDAILIFDPTTDEILDCNSETCELLGYSREELLSLGPSDIHPHELDRLNSFVDSVHSNGHGWTTDLSCYTSDQEPVPAEISASRLTIDGRSAILASVRDISDRKRYERRLEELNETTRRMMTAESVAEIAEITVDAIHRVLGYSLSVLWEFDAETGQLSPIEMTDAVAEFLERDDRQKMDVAIEPETAEMQAFVDGDARYLEEYDAVDEPAHPEFPIESRLLFPLGEHGLLAVGMRESAAIPEPMQDLLHILAGSVETALDRLANQKKVTRRSVAMEAANEGIAIMNDGQEFVFVNAAYADLFGYADPDQVQNNGWRALLDDESIERIETEVLPALDEEGAWRGELCGVSRDGSQIDLNVGMTRLEDGGVVNVCSDISRQKTQERRLRGLNNMNRDLLQAENWEKIARLGLSTITECLPFEIVAVRRFDSDANVLELDEMTDKAATLLESRPAYDLELTYAGTAYRRGEPVVNETVDEPQMGDYKSFASLHVPLQEYGTLSVLTDDTSLLNEDVVEFVQLVGTALGMSVGRVKREEKLRKNRDELSRLNRITTVVRGIIQSLVEASTRNEIERTICEQLTNSDLYDYAWIGEVDVDNDDIAPRASAGIEMDVLRATTVMDIFDTEADTIMNAARAGEIETIKQYQLSEDTDDIKAEVVDDKTERTEVIAVIPLSHGSQTYEVLIVSTTRSGTFDEGARAEFQLLGETAGFAISAAQNRQLLLSNRITELKFDVWDSRLSVVAISDELDCMCRLETAEPTPDGGIRSYLRANSIAGEAPEAATVEIQGIERLDVVGDTSDECLLEVVRSDPLVEELAQTGANIRTAVAEHGEGEVVLEVPQSADIRKTVDKFQSLLPDSKLVAKRKRERDGTSVEEFEASVEKELTERQQAVLERAYEIGYFDWPRDSTAEEVAEALDISSPTLHQHLRMAEQKLISTLFDD